MYICTYYKVIIQFPQIAKNTEPVRNRVFLFIHQAADTITDTI